VQHEAGNSVQQHTLTQGGATPAAGSRGHIVAVTRPHTCV
jgi:hypothetical protein